MYEVWYAVHTTAQSLLAMEDAHSLFWGLTHVTCEIGVFVCL